MKKISTLFKKDPNDLGRVINEVDPENQWVIDGYSKPMRKWDGTAVAVIDGELYRRYDAKHGKPAPVGGIPCQDPDPITGHWPHWIKCSRSNPADKYHFEGFDNYPCEDGTYELVGEKLQGNPDKIKGHVLIKHDTCPLEVLIYNYDWFNSLKDYLSKTDIEGIVFHHEKDGRMCKIRKTDFGIKR